MKDPRCSSQNPASSLFRDAGVNTGLESNRSRKSSEDPYLLFPIRNHQKYVEYSYNHAYSSPKTVSFLNERSEQDKESETNSTTVHRLLAPPLSATQQDSDRKSINSRRFERGPIEKASTGPYLASVDKVRHNSGLIATEKIKRHSALISINSIKGSICG